MNVKIDQPTWFFLWQINRKKDEMLSANEDMLSNVAIQSLFELIAKIVPKVWARLSFSSKMTLLYHFAPHICNFLPFSSKYLTKLLYTV
ncbi:hypothetical protein Hanom_Chr11g01057311 [Helianthus anomalus]